ncbi:hypothetical protein HPG69_013967 [Diceros bicornis minor]|uniref:Vomeronasal type-1 receptor n=1 Tax=Diceros bicornis minor TaxID=77932 RepID=A0A7J7EMW1_DICBM|nr:hypothetical protein HPG69_013967 [Diceros bicornis minor]
MIHRAHASFSCAGISGSEDDCQSLGFDRIATRDLVMGMMCRSTDLILKLLTVANLLVILSKGVPETRAAFGLKLFLNDFGCKLLFYVHRVGRDVFVGTICLLNVFQVITAELKVKATKYRGTSNILCWILNMMLNILVPFHMTEKRNNTIIRKKTDQGLSVLLVLFHDGFCLVLMIWASGSMVVILHRHKQSVRYIHRNNLSPRSSPETRATQSVLVLVSTSVSLWILSFIFHICLTVFNNPILWLKNISTLITACFPTVSPYILVSHDPRVSRFWFAWNEIQNPLNLS